MQQDTGLFIAIEGIDGAGKATQCHLLRRRLEAAGYGVELFDFPQYSETSSYFVKQYLSGVYGKLGDVGPYRTALFYALDRYDAARRIREALAAGKVVLANRFTGSNMAHQGAKISRSDERRGYYIWLDNLEFEILGLTRPVLSIVLQLPVAIARELDANKPKRSYASAEHDDPQANMADIAKIASTYDELAQLFPRDFQAIDCLRGGELLDPDTIHNLVWGKVEPLLPIIKQHEEPATDEKANSSLPNDPETQRQLSVLAAMKAGIDDTAEATKVIAPAPSESWFYTPDGLGSETREIYVTTLDQLRSLYDDMSAKLATHVAKGSPLRPSDTLDSWVRSVLQRVLPLATLVTFTPNDTGRVTTERLILGSTPANTSMHDLAQTSLPHNHAGHGEAITLTSFWPRNELDLVADMLYEFSDQPLETIQQEVARWPYDKKASVLRTYTIEHLQDNNRPSVLDKVQYNWDLITDVTALRMLVSAATMSDVAWQPLSPRLGYDIPAIVNEAGLADSFEQCFDLSLRLYSQLQQAGHVAEAQYATLLGHRLRWKATCRARNLPKVNSTTPTSQFLDDVVQQLRQLIAEVHHLLIESADFADDIDRPGTSVDS